MADKTVHARQLEAVASVEKFTPLSDQVFVLRPPEDDTGNRANHEPDVVIIYGWGDGRLTQVGKYADGYRILFPAAKIIVVISSVLKGLFRSQDQRIACVLPVIEEAFGDGSRRPSVLAHVMSNTGMLHFTASLEGYKKAFGHLMPHALLVMDSAPGSMETGSANISNLADAMALGAKSQFPWPPAVTKVLIVMILYTMRTVELLRSRENPVAVSIDMAKDEAFATRSSPRLYIYSKEDLVTAWEAVEKHAAEAKERGYKVYSALCEGSGHVEHMKRWPEKYWGIIRTAWEDASRASSPVRARL